MNSFAFVPNNETEINNHSFQYFTSLHDSKRSIMIFSSIFYMAHILIEVSIYIKHHLEKPLPKCKITFLTDFSFIDKIRLITLFSLEDVTLVILVNLALFSDKRTDDTQSFFLKMYQFFSYLLGALVLRKKDSTFVVLLFIMICSSKMQRRALICQMTICPLVI